MRSGSFARTKYLFSSTLRTFRKSKRWATKFRISNTISECKTFFADGVLSTTASQLSRRSKIASLRMKRHRHSKVSFGQQSFIPIISQMVSHFLLFDIESRITVSRLITSIFFSFWNIHIFEIYSIVALVKRPSVSLTKFLIWVS